MLEGGRSCFFSLSCFPFFFAGVVFRLNALHRDNEKDNKQAERESEGEGEKEKKLPSENKLTKPRQNNEKNSKKKTLLLPFFFFFSSLSLTELLRVRNYVNAVLCNATGKPMAEVQRDFNRNKYFSAEEALEYGVIDRILPPPRTVQEELAEAQKAAASGKGRPVAGPKKGVGY